MNGSQYGWAGIVLAPFCLLALLFALLPSLVMISTVIVASSAVANGFSESVRYHVRGTTCNSGGVQVSLRDTMLAYRCVHSFSSCGFLVYLSGLFGTHAGFPICKCKHQMPCSLRNDTYIQYSKKALLACGTLSHSFHLCILFQLMLQTGEVGRPTCGI